MHENVSSRIASIFLCQPAAPKFFEVEDEAGRHLFVQWRGSAWVEFRRENLDERASAGLAAAGNPRMTAGENPASSTDLSSGGECVPANAGNHRNPEQFVERQEAAIKDGADDHADSRRGARPAHSPSHDDTPLEDQVWGYCAAGPAQADPTNIKQLTVHDAEPRVFRCMPKVGSFSELGSFFVQAIYSLRGDGSRVRIAGHCAALDEMEAP